MQEGKAQHKKLEKIHLSGGANAELNFSHLSPLSFCYFFIFISAFFVSLRSPI